jgi:RNA polymerase sigma-70 factor (ECF subfamily)
MAREGQQSWRTEAPRELIERARHDRWAFGELYDHYLPRVFAFCRMRSSSREEAEDLTAETFERALAAIERFEVRGLPFSAWLLRIAANVTIDSARRGRAISGEAGVQLASDTEQVEDWTHAWWLRGHVTSLPVDQREVVRLRFFEDQRFSEVAARMGRSEGAVKQLLRRALKALSAQIGNEESFHG